MEKNSTAHGDHEIYIRISNMPLLPGNVMIMYYFNLAPYLEKKFRKIYEGEAYRFYRKR